ncbi:Uncharacterised protein [Achromobacter ruhlandii]|nr:Uncharacterised protein [Achromobacter ruhlandii]CUJ96393.1 Uncharacterised protein [Achromobacter ruhlandii]
MLRLPPASATTCLPLATAPRRRVSPPDSRARRSPAVTWLLVQVTSLPSPRPLAPLALAVTPKARPFWPTDIATPTPALTLLLLRSVSKVFLAASRLISPSALSTASPPARMSLPRTVRLESGPPLASMRTSPPAATAEPAAVSVVAVDLLSLLLAPTVIEILTPPADCGSAWTAS